MNIALVVGDFLSTSNALSIRGQAIAKELADQGHSVTVFCGRHPADFSGSNIKLRCAPFSLPKNNLPLWRRIIGELLLGMYFSWSMLFTKKAHLIITTPPFIVMVVVVSFAKLLGIGYTLDVRDLYPEVYANSGLLSPAGRLYKLIDWMIARIYRGAVNIVTVTPGLSGALEKRLDGARVMIAMNGFVAKRFFPENTKLSYGGNLVTVISHGNFGELFDMASFEFIARGLAGAVKRPYEIILVGFGKKLAELREKNLPNVRVLGALTQDKVAKLVRAADVGLSLHFPYNRDINGFPVKVFEFIGCGLPSVVMPRNEGGRFVSDHGFGFSFDQSEVALAVKALQTLIEDDKARSDIAKHIFSQRQSFSLEGQVEIFGHLISCKSA